MMRGKVVELPHGRRLAFDRPLVMGIVNATPDSFSDGGLYLDPTAATAHGERLLAEGADILDVGGESTRPAATPVDVEEEARRVLPIVRALAGAERPLSIDTMKARVAADAIAAGASIINDVWGLQRDPDMARVAAETGAFVVAMHNRDAVDGAVDILADVIAFLSRSVDRALAAGVAADKIAIDPGFGFGKTHAQSLALVRDLGALRALGFPILLGVSRKRAIGHATNRSDPADRLVGSVVCAVMGVERGADIVRAHDVAAHVDALALWSAVVKKESDA